MGEGRAGGADGIRGSKTRLRLSLEKEEEKQSTLLLTRRFSRSRCAAWLQQYFSLPLTWCRWTRDCEANRHKGFRTSQHYLTPPLPNTNEYPGVVCFLTLKHNTCCCAGREELVNACFPLQTTNISESALHSLNRRRQNHPVKTYASGFEGSKSISILRS